MDKSEAKKNIDELDLIKCVVITMQMRENNEIYELFRRLCIHIDYTAD